VSASVRRVSEAKSRMRGRREEGGDTNTNTATNKVWRTSAEVCTATPHLSSVQVCTYKRTGTELMAEP
jgi:hypothetical protein